MTTSYETSSLSVASRSTDRLLGVLVWLVLGWLVIGLPAGYFIIGLSAHGAALQTKTEAKAATVNQAINRSPLMWRFEEHRLKEILERQPIVLEGEYAAIIDQNGQVIAASNHVLTRPTISRSVPLFDAGSQVGHVVMEDSLFNLTMGTSVGVLIGLMLASGVFIGFRRLQTQNQRSAAVILDEQERARVTLHAIGDGVITTDSTARIQYLNPVAERLTQWTLAEARGKPLTEVCTLIDEDTMEEVPTQIIKALCEGQFCPFSGKNIALLRRDGSSLAIEDSAAPIRNHLGEVIGGAMVFHDVTANRHMAKGITWAATHDELTRLVNRREFETRVEAAILSAQNSEHHHVLCYLDLDQFKIINDTCGHAAGDALLKQIAGVLQGKLRESDTLARLGGDEFGVLLQGCPLEQAKLISADLLAAVRDYRFPWDGRWFTVGVSIGIVAITANSGNSAEVFSAADTACYSAKEQGRNRFCVYHGTDADMTQRRTEMGWAARLTTALDEDRFMLYYQPYMALGLNSAKGNHIEILLRLIDEDGKMVQPGSFLPAAERYNIMPDIDRWVIRAVFTRYHALAALMGEPLTCAINLSGTTLNSEGILEFIRELSQLHPLPPGALCFEITETVAINNMRRTTQFMRDINALGFGFALDDFGVGTSSLAYLKTLPVDYLKIDGSFIRNIAHDPIDRAMADTINRVGHIMGLQTVAEYAESEVTISELRTLGVDFAQGYAVQRPQPLPDTLVVPLEISHRR